MDVEVRNSRRTVIRYLIGIRNHWQPAVCDCSRQMNGPRPGATAGLVAGTSLGWKRRQAKLSGIGSDPARTWRTRRVLNGFKASEGESAYPLLVLLITFTNPARAYNDAAIISLSAPHPSPSCCADGSSLLRRIRRALAFAMEAMAIMSEFAP
jgi:hypothetical protein